MHACDNCNAPFSVNDGLEVRQGKQTVAKVCPNCLSGTRVIKLVLKKPDIGETFAYDQFSALEMAQKAFGKAG